MTTTVSNDVLASILSELQSLKTSHQQLDERLSALAVVSPISPATRACTPSQPIPIGGSSFSSNGFSTSNVQSFSAGSDGGTTPLQLGSPRLEATSPPITSSMAAHSRKFSTTNDNAKQAYAEWVRNSPQPPSLHGSEKSMYPSRAILTTYPGQVGVTPLALKWAAQSPEERGPILASRQKTSLGLRNAIGAYGGAYSIYHALSVAIGALDPNQRPNYTNTEPTFEVPPNSSWFDATKIVTLDPWGHRAQLDFKKQIDAGIDIRPTISITRAHLKIAELDDAVRAGRIHIDGKIVIPSTAATMANVAAQNSAGEFDASAQESLKHIAADAGVEVNVSKVAFEHVWYLPGVAQRLGVSETLLRRCLFEDTGGMYPELLTRQDLKTFLPPIGGGTCYIFGNTKDLRNPDINLACRVHDACSGSDIFGSDICTCRPYLLHGIEEAIKCSQKGGVGLIVYFQKEGRALGEVTKYLVYNARKRGVDTASQYFQRTENIAGVKDMRFQAFMPDVLHWLGVKKIHDLYSMSDMKYDAITSSGIEVLNRHDIPDYLIPPDSAVEIQAKINAGYFSSKGSVATEDLSKTVGRAWEELEH